ncbi:hypothetical protein [uncultured Litoreibacter sp.]|uniref:hypothetical protein n=1 Tax=uncultured Litoreibacter sp. TaxID=1392394 RepID=UPI00261173E0|nr:hypothetical protein [uncultured Litoreibacter sp.]
MKWLAALMMLSVPAMGQSALDIDFNALFEGGAGQDQITTHGVTLMRRTEPNGSVSYQGTDATEQGAVGCWMMIAVHAAAMDRKCDLPINPSERHALDNLLGGIARFYAKNNFPVLPEGRDLPSVRAAIEVLIRSERSSIPAAVCTGEAADFVVSFIDGLRVDAAEQDFLDVLGPARLPVANPCF